MAIHPKEYRNKQLLCTVPVPYDDALLLCGGLRQAEGCVSDGVHMPGSENNKR